MADELLRARHFPTDPILLAAIQALFGTGGGGGLLVWPEPGNVLGIIDGVNDSFTLIAEPSPPKSLMLYKNGILQAAEGNDYTLSGLTITFVEDAIPEEGDVLTAMYQV
jgi:hypothetical protein